MAIGNHLEAKILKLLAYCQANDWAGYDPYDAVNSHVFAALPFLNSRLSRADDRKVDRASITRSSLLVLGIQFSVADTHDCSANRSAQSGVYDVRGQRAS